MPRPSFLSTIDYFDGNHRQGSSVSDSKLEMPRVRCALRGLLDEVFAEIRVEAESQGIQFDHEYCGQPPETILTDPTCLRKALVGLGVGAIRLSRADTICALILAVRNAGPEVLIRFDLIDPVTRITEERISRLFHPLCESRRRAEDTQLPELGLPTSKRQAQMLGGDLTVQPLAVGTRYRLTFPVGPCDDQALQPTADDRRRLKQAGSVSTRGLPPGCHILLVEDDEDHQPLLSLFLRKAGCQVTLAENGQVALDLATEACNQGQPFDLILMDVQMPVLDGLATTRLMRSNGISNPIIAVTARAMASERQKCFDAGCDDFLSKPVNRDDLLQCLSNHVNRSVLPDELTLNSSSQN